tara:strand:+ start:652 stop:1056 length:405 start_codon:yes stop_codon:yes gene_type:complete
MFRKLQELCDIYTNDLDDAIISTNHRYAKQHLELAKMQITQLFNIIDNVRNMRRKSIAEIDELKKQNLVSNDVFGGIRASTQVAIDKQLEVIRVLYNENIDEAFVYDNAIPNWDKIKISSRQVEIFYSAVYRAL